MQRLNVVYFRTMVDSPEVTIECATTSRLLAERALLQAKRQEEEWMADEDEDSGNWAEACIRTFEVPGSLKEGDTINLVVLTEWYEEVTTNIYPLIRKDDAETMAQVIKRDYLEQYPGLTPFDEDETIEEATHLEDPDVAVDIYVDIQSVTLQ